MYSIELANLQLANYGNIKLANFGNHNTYLPHLEIIRFVSFGFNQN